MAKKSFSDRLSLRLLTVLLVTITVVAFFVIKFATTALKSTIIGYFMSELQVANESIEKRLYGVEVASDNTVDEITDCLDSPEEVFEAMNGKLEPNDIQIVGFGAAFEPYFFPNQGKWFEAYAFRVDSLIQQKQIGSPSHDYFNKEWYQNTLDAKRGYWSDPYFDDTVTQILMCSYFRPIINKAGRRVGVFGADFSLDWLYDRMTMLDSKVNEYFPLTLMGSSGKAHGKSWPHSIIFDSQGTYVFHPDKQRILKDNFYDNIRESSDTLINQLMRGLESGEKLYQEIKINGIISYIFYTRVKHSNWTNAIVVSRRILLSPIIFMGLLLLGAIILGLLVTYWVSRSTIRRSTRPLELLAKSADEVAKGNFQAPLPELKYDDEITQLRDSFSNMQQSLTQYIDQLKTATAQKAAIESEISIAHDIQMSSVPTTFPELDEIHLYGSMTPAKAVGGDLYDFFVQDGKLYFCIGDVSGKGVPAALLMMVTKSLFRAYADDGSMPDRIISRMNDDLSRNNESCMFVTLLVGVLDLTSKVLSYSNAGHEAPVLIKENAHKLHMNPSLPVGAFTDSAYELQTVALEPQTTILFFTDGLSEAMDANGKMFGRKRILSEVDSAGRTGLLSPKELIERMTDAVHDFVGDTEQSDDLTLLCIRID